jgi:RND family efflux transporter MFP subunit
MQIHSFSLRHLASARARAVALRAALILGGAAAVGGCESRAETPPPGAMPPPTVSVAPAVRRQVQEFDEFTGRLEAPWAVDVRPRVTGYIKKVHFHDGQEVKEGQLLFTIDPDPYLAELARARAQLAAAQTQVELARSEEARADKLIDIKAISQQEYDQLTSGTRNAAANVKAAEAAVQSAELNVGYTEIRAPIAGKVSRANVTAGNLVNIGDPVLTSIVSQDKVYAYFDAPEDAYLRFLKAGRESHGKDQGNVVLMGLADEQGYPHRGTMDFVDNRLNVQTGAMRARAVFDNSERRFTPGLFARIKLLGSGTYSAVLTPEQAIGTDQTKKFVLVVGDDRKAQFREVTSGVYPGDLVVVDGLQRARPGTPVTPERLPIDDRGMPVRKSPEVAAGQS